MTERTKPWSVYKQRETELQFFLVGMVPIRGVIKKVAPDFLVVQMTDPLEKIGSRPSPVTGLPDKVTIFPKNHLVDVAVAHIIFCGVAYDEP
jgi:hypothetical protein